MKNYGELPENVARHSVCQRGYATNVYRSPGIAARRFVFCENVCRVWGAVDGGLQGQKLQTNFLLVHFLDCWFEQSVHRIECLAMFHPLYLLCPLPKQLHLVLHGCLRSLQCSKKLDGGEWAVGLGRAKAAVKTRTHRFLLE